jgi:hypothetical protein
MRAILAPAQQSGTGLFSDPLEPPSMSQLEIAAQQNIDTNMGGTVDKSVKDSIEPTSSIAEAEEEDDAGSEGEVVFEYVTEAEPIKPDPNAFFGTAEGPNQIEGFLRDTWYPPRDRSSADVPAGVAEPQAVPNVQQEETPPPSLPSTQEPPMED